MQEQGVLKPSLPICPHSEFLSDLGRHNYVTPTSYLELIASFRTLLDAKRAQVCIACNALPCPPAQWFPP